MNTITWFPPRRAWLWMPVFAAAYLVLAPLSKLTVFPEFSVSILSLSTAVFVGLIARLPANWLLALIPTLMVSELANLIIFEAALTNTVWAWVLATTVEVVVIGLALKAARVRSLTSVAELARFVGVVLIGGFIVAPLGAFAIVNSLGGEWAMAYLGWWLSDVSAILVLTPFVLLVDWRRHLSGRELAEFCLFTVGAISVACFEFLVGNPFFGHGLWIGLSVPFLLWISLRFGLRPVALVAPIVVWIGAAAAADGLGLYQELTPTAHEVVPVQVFLVMVCLTTYAAGIVADSKREAIDTLYRGATTDELTGLLNRNGAITTLHQRMLDQEQNSGPRRTAVLVLDLVGFSSLNTTLGHAAGDAALRHCAQRLQECVADRGISARLGGDEFVVILDNVHSRIEAFGTAEDVAEALGAPLILAGNRRVLSVDIGMSFGSRDLDPTRGSHDPDFPLMDINDLLTRADMALHETKADSNSRIRVYTDTLSEQVQANVAGELLVREALRHNWVDTWLQPIVDPASGRPVSAEALVRITTPDGVTHSPAEFIEVAEASDLIIELGERVLGQALDWLTLRREQDPAFQVAVNVSVRQLNEPDFPSRLRAAIERRGLPASALIIEVTERLMLDPRSVAQSNLERLVQLNFGLAIDDFGTGYASLTAFQRLPATEIKVDRSFVSRVLTEREARAIVAATVSISHTLDRVVVAEGVESAEQIVALQQLGIDLIQGYFYAPPRPRNEFPTDEFPPMPTVPLLRSS